MTMSSTIPIQDPKLVGKSARAIAVSLRRPLPRGTPPRTIYMSAGKLGLPLLVWGCALVNVVFWGNLADWTWRDYSVKVVVARTATTTTNEVGSPSSDVTTADEAIRYERAPANQRATYAIGLAALGLGISTLFLLVSRRVVNRIDMMPDGVHVLLHTGFLPRRTASAAVTTSSRSTKVVALTDLSLKASLDTAATTATTRPGSASTVGNYTQLLRKKQIIGYLIDRRGHFLGGPKVLDELFVRAS